MTLTLKNIVEFAPEPKFSCCQNVKSIVISIPFTVVLFFAFLMVNFSLYAQTDKLDEESISMMLDPNSELAYMQIHDQYKWGLDPLAFVNGNSFKNSPNEFAFFMDSVYVYSVNSNTKRYINTYTAQGLKENTTLELFENGGWVNLSVQEYIYDDNDNNISWLWKSWQDGDWKNTSRNTYTYSVNNEQLTSSSEIWLNEVWENNNRHEYAYNTSGKVVYHLHETWADTAWEYVSQEFYTYDNSGNMLTANGELWANYVWRNDQQHTYSFDGSNNMLNGLSETWFGGIWENTFNETYTYNAVNKRLTYFIEVWSDSVWDNLQQYSYSYNTLGLLETRIAEIWQTDNWLNTEKGQYTYAAFNGPETSLIKHWDGNDWINFSLTQHEYDEYGNASSGEYFNWDGNTWVQNQEGLIPMYYNYSTQAEYYIGYLVEANYISLIVGINNDLPITVSNFICSPNPASAYAILNIELTRDEFVDIDMYSISGIKIQDIFQGNLVLGKHNYTILTNDLPSGTYFISLVSTNTRKTIKLIISK